MKTYKESRLLKRLMTFVCISILISCHNKINVIDVNPEFSKYIDSYTSGVIYRQNTILIQLAAETATTHAVNETLKEGLFSFSPAVKGKAYWTDARTIEFKPEEDLKTNQLYEISFKLNRILDVPERYSTFRFNVQTIRPSFEVEEFGLRSNGKQIMTLSGRIRTADVEESVKVEKLLTASLNNNNIKIDWQHNEANKTHDFILNSIERKNIPGRLVLNWTGEALGTDIKGSKTIEVPAINDFKVLNVRAVLNEEQYALVQFSDPLAVGQSLEGLIGISNQENISYSILGSEVKVYTSNPLDGNYTANIHEGIENEWGKKLDKTFTSNVFFENRLPSVKIQGRGNILPNSSGKLVLPFEAINLKAVDISIIKIYENNIFQFLLENDMNGENELRRVGKPLIQSTVRLDNDKTLNLNNKNRFLLDLEKYIHAEPGAIYRLMIAFRPEYSLYTCKDVQETDDEDEEDNSYDYYYASNSEKVDEDEEFWRRYQDYYPYGYNWDQKDNPCHKSYYNKERFAGRNILASNIGITAKGGNNNSLFVAVSNLITTEPMNGVEIQILDYQQQIIAKAKSNSDGIVMLNLKTKPYLLIAKQGTEKGYLKLDDANSLPLSRFDVSGNEVKEGIKAFIFGERGVWRPGDSLYLSCIIDDKDNKLPADHPIEMELISPRGQLYKRLVQTKAADGFNVFRTVTDEGAPTGNWICRVKFGGASFEKKLKIETIMPNRLKIDLNFNGLEALGKNAMANGILTAKWLFGATAQNLKARVDAQLYKKTTTFSDFKDYVFDNPTTEFSPQSKTIFDGALSDEGTAAINPTFDVGEQAPGQLLANLLVKVFEPGGNFSIDNVSMPFNPYTSYIGVRVPEGDKTWGWLQSGKIHRFDIADVDTRGNPTNGPLKVEVQLYKIQWQWWWDNSGDGLSNFTQDEFNKFIKKDTVTVNNGKGSYDLNIGEDNWGRYLILLKDTRSGHITGSTFYIDDYSWQTRGDNSDPSAAAMLSFTSNKEKYNVGEDVKLTIPTSKDGRALISIETGTKVIKTYWLKTEPGQTKFSFKADNSMSPNVYVNISLIQPHAQTINDLPIRMYGIIPIQVEDKNTLLNPVINMQDVIRPEQKNTITVSEATGKSMTYVIALVDEGLLDLTHYTTPNPHDAFFAKEALGVKSWDVFDEVIGAWGGQLERILTIGGDAEAILAAKTRRANRFKPIVEFMGPFKLDGGKRTHSFALPSYMGSVRAMVIAGNGDSYGIAEKSVKVKKPLMLLATLPRVLAPLEELNIPVTVFATTNNIKNVNLTIENNPFIDAGGRQNIKFNTNSEQLVYFKAKVKKNTGIGKVKIIAQSGKEQAVYEVEMNIRNPNPSITQVTEVTLAPNQSWNKTVAKIGSENSSNAVLEISSIPAINLEKRLNYLITYPHGCVEQITSSVFPQLTLNQLMDLTDQHKRDIDRNIHVAIQKLQNFQTTEGGFSYWPGENFSDDWGSNYAGHFLLEASAKGYNVSASLLQQWKQYERKKALSWNVTSAPLYGSDLSQAYRLFLLALAGAPETGAMNRLKEYKFLTPEAKWRLAGAYQIIGQTQVALKLITGLSTSFPERPYPGITYGSNLRNQAIVLETLSIMKRRNEAEQLVRTVASKLSQEEWLSTQTTAYALIAISRFSGNNADNKKIIAGGKAGLNTVNINSNSVISQTNIKWQNNKGEVQLTNKGGNILYVRVLNQGQPLSYKSAPVINNANILQVTAAYFTTAGQSVDVTNIKQGTDFVAKITVKNPGLRGVYDQMALTQIFPGGWEILNTRLYNTEGSFTSSPSEYMDIRDDRVYHYFDLKQNGTLIYYVQLNAAYPGRYFWPGVYCETMYDHTISGGVSGKWVEVSE